MDYDDTLRKIGEFGFYQKRVYFIVCLIAIPAAFNNLGYVFWAARLDHWCKVDKPDDFLNVSVETWKKITIPTAMSEDGKSIYESCLRYDLSKLNITSRIRQLSLNNGSLDYENSGEGKPLLPCDGWDYDYSQYESSIVADYNLVCERQWLKSISQSLYMASRIGGTLGLGAVADRLGRRKTILMSIVLQLAASIAIAFAPEMYSFMIIRSVCAVCSTGSFQTTYVLVMEIVGPSKRVFVGTVIMVYWAVGYVLLAVLAYFIRDHRILQLVISVPFITMLLFYWIIPESPRWLLAKGRKSEAMKIIYHIAKVNKKDIPEELDITISGSSKNEVQKTAWYESIKSPYLWRMSLVLFVIWFSTSSVYYGMSLNTSDLAGNDYFNCFISGAVEIPAYFLCYISFVKYGRQIPLLCNLVVAGISLLATGFIPKGSHIPIVTLAMVGKFCITCAYSMIYIYTAELYPTTVRSMGIGVCSTMSRIGGILAPFAAELGQYYPGLPLIIFGIMSTTSGISVLILPETKDQILPQTLQDGAILAKQSSVISRCCKNIPHRSSSISLAVHISEKEELNNQKC